MTEKYRPSKEEVKAAEEQLKSNEDYARLSRARQADRNTFGLGGLITKIEHGKNNVELAQETIDLRKSIEGHFPERPETGLDADGQEEEEPIEDEEPEEEPTGPVNFSLKNVLRKNESRGGSEEEEEEI
jgi:hypothetical protein